VLELRLTVDVATAVLVAPALPLTEEALAVPFAAGTTYPDVGAPLRAKIANSPPTTGRAAKTTPVAKSPVTAS